MVLVLITITFTFVTAKALDLNFHSVCFRRQTQTLIIVLSALRVTSRTMLFAFYRASKLVELLCLETVIFFLLLCFISC